MKKLFRNLAIAISALVVIVLFRTFTVPSLQVRGTESPQPALDDVTIFHRLSEAIKSGHDLDRFRAEIKREYADVFSHLDHHLVNEQSLVMKWSGTSTEERPVLLLAHQDVVPVGDAKKWEHPPFSGADADGFIWGRGTLDDRSTLLAQLEAIRLLLKEGRRPRRSIYLAYGHDEESGGSDGAAKIAEEFQTQGIHFDWVLDEGLFIFSHLMASVPKPVALVGVAEKGYVELELKALGKPGHSSMPGAENAILVLSEAHLRLNDGSFSRRITAPILDMTRYLASEADFTAKMAFANMWLFSPLVKRILKSDPSTNALIQTTMAPTMVNGGVAPNVIPDTVTAVLNLRILPGETIESVASRVRETISDERVTVSVREKAVEPSPISSADSEGFRHIQASVSQIFSGTLTAPSLLIAATDARHYQPVADDIYRFMPVALERADYGRFHGHNERISKEAYKNMIRFYRHLLLTSAFEQGN
ncbi:MAG: M20/M25/M40 family metallo-hydrolase [Pseudobdellovibrionaceae bacterium]|nr:M20/M25/M40 family metallo-hydrolase [Bdellovibrionales bacterium]USN46595.1 MAG: M20/M25/M40 family metallo-hydrolase [Pseudobdellovibrionaceae bacterium]